jgi:hypothetical protein
VPAELTSLSPRATRAPGHGGPQTRPASAPPAPTPVHGRADRRPRAGPARGSQSPSSPAAPGDAARTIDPISNSPMVGRFPPRAGADGPRVMAKK